MRRLIVEEPVSRAALWSRRLAVFGLAVAGSDLFLARRGLDPMSVLAVFGAALLLAGMALLAAGAAAVVIWRTGRRGAGVAGGGTLLALALLAYPAYLAVQAVELPPLADVSTDTADPPDFSLSRKALDARRGMTPASAAAGDRAAQARAYPDVQPVLLDLDAEDAYQAVLTAAAASGWQIVDRTPPGRRMGTGHVDAVARSLLLRLPYDVTVRIRPLAGQTRIDIRCAQRIGRHDFGGGVAQIRTFTAALQDAETN
jgi:hypothetical protein